jgi:hypothetical protein
LRHAVVASSNERPILLQRLTRRRYFVAPCTVALCGRTAHWLSPEDLHSISLSLLKFARIGCVQELSMTIVFTNIDGALAPDPCSVRYLDSIFWPANG